MGKNEAEDKHTVFWFIKPQVNVSFSSHEWWSCQSGLFSLHTFVNIVVTLVYSHLLQTVYQWKRIPIPNNVQTTICGIFSPVLTKHGFQGYRREIMGKITILNALSCLFFKARVPHPIKPERNDLRSLWWPCIEDTTWMPEKTCSSSRLRV